MRLREAAALARPNDPQARSDLSLSYSKLGWAHLLTGDSAKALEMYEKCWNLRETLARRDSEDARAPGLRRLVRSARPAIGDCVGRQDP